MQRFDTLVSLVCCASNLSSFLKGRQSEMGAMEGKPAMCSNEIEAKSLPVRWTTMEHNANKTQSKNTKKKIK